MRAIVFGFMLLAAFGLVLSILAHIAALMGVLIPGGKLVWALHIGIFVVWLPAVLVAGQVTRYANREDFWKLALAGCPGWMHRAFYVLFGYAILNFIVFLLVVGTQEEKTTGDAPPSVVRGFSGHWMVFYGGAFFLLYSRINAPHLYQKRKCPRGHPVSPTDRFCPKCGYAFPDEPGSAE
ncbi:MAG: zinc ribbon domain-containing protein [Limisphaerales bacterium]